MSRRVWSAVCVVKANVVSAFAPFDRSLGDQPRLSSEEIDAIVAFLYTLRDGYEL